jgi:hypothetical protein
VSLMNRSATGTVISLMKRPKPGIDVPLDHVGVDPLRRHGEVARVDLLKPQLRQCAQPGVLVDLT